jgi:hypothetical protein
MPTRRIATFNLEDLFTCPTAMNMTSDAAGRKAIEDHTDADKKKLVTLVSASGSM